MSADCTLSSCNALGGGSTNMPPPEMETGPLLNGSFTSIPFSVKLVAPQWEPPPIAGVVVPAEGVAPYGMNPGAVVNAVSMVCTEVGRSASCCCVTEPETLISSVCTMGAAAAT